MSKGLFLKMTLFGTVLVLAMIVVTAAIPETDRWPDAVTYMIFVVAALAAIVYVRKHGGDGQAEQSLPSGKVDDSARWKMGAVGVAMGIYFLLGGLLLGGLQWLLGCLLIASGARLVLQYFWLKRKRADARSSDVG